ncbi:MAG: AmmeMemoRadiSam system radical SAM enzyme [Bacteroidota bacterium]
MLAAAHYKTKEDQKVQCRLCPHYCLLEPGQYGKCKTRVNLEGNLYAENFGILSAISTDPIEKKPLYHFYPGKSILSIGGFGCNMTCDYCQNCDISQIDHRIFSHHPSRDPEDIVGKAVLHRDNIGLAYTYNEPTIYFEYMLRCAKLIKEQDRCNVMVTNGYINGEPLDELLSYMDAFNLDLKSFRNEFYQSRAGATLTPVLHSIERIVKSGKHLELTFLIIPELNDKKKEWMDMVDWIHEVCGRDTVLHVSRYFPRYKLRIPPTPLSTMERFMDLAREKLLYVYPGNTPQLDSHTRCPGCGKVLIQRFLYNTSVTGMTGDGFCKHCNYKIKGVFK